MERSVEFAEGFGLGPVVPVSGLEGEVDVVVQAAEIVPAVLACDVGPDTQTAGILQLDSHFGEGIAPRIGDQAPHVTLFELAVGR